MITSSNEPVCRMEISHADEWATLVFSLGGEYTGGPLIIPSENFISDIHGKDEPAAGYEFTTWSSGIHSGALYAFSSLQVTRRRVRLLTLKGELGSSEGVQALAEGTSRGIAHLLNQEHPATELEGWDFSFEQVAPTSSSS